MSLPWAPRVSSQTDETRPSNPDNPDAISWQQTVSSTCPRLPRIIIDILFTTQCFDEPHEQQRGISISCLFPAVPGRHHVAAQGSMPCLVAKCHDVILSLV